MLNTIRGSLWFRLSLLSGLVFSGIVGGVYGLVAASIIPVQVAFLLCILVSVFVVPITLRIVLASFRQLVRVASSLSEGESLIVKSTEVGDIGQIAQAFRALQAATQAAMARMIGADGHEAHTRSVTGWPIVTIGRTKRPWVRWTATGCVAVAGIAGVLFALLHAIPIKTSAASVTPSVEVRSSSAPPRGVTKDSITMGMSAPFTGAARSLSEGMKLGIDTAFAEVNASGGVHGRQLKLIALDNGYDETRAMTTTRDLIENRRVFGLIGNVGTPTVKAVLPYINSNKVLLFGPLTGSPVTRTDPPDRYVFNVRSSYELETSAMVRYLLDVKHLSARSIVVFAQRDSYGDAGYEGAVKTLRKKGYPGELFRVGYERNTADVQDAATSVMTYNSTSIKAGGGVRAVIVVATATASAAFTAKISEIEAIVLNVSFVDGAQLALEFKDRWPGVGNGVIVTQVVPHFDSGATGVIRYRDSLKAFYPDKTPGFASLEGYVVGSLFAEGLRKAGPDVDTERVINTLEKIKDLDLGTGGAFSFGVSNHQAGQKVWGTRLTANGTFQPLDAEWTE